MKTLYMIGTMRKLFYATPEQLASLHAELDGLGIPARAKHAPKALHGLVGQIPATDFDLQRPNLVKEASK